jgi:hypothetical protein
MFPLMLKRVRQDIAMFNEGEADTNALASYPAEAEGYLDHH